MVSNKLQGPSRRQTWGKCVDMIKAKIQSCPMQYEGHTRNVREQIKLEHIFSKAKELIISLSRGSADNSAEHSR